MKHIAHWLRANRDGAVFFACVLAAMAAAQVSDERAPPSAPQVARAAP